MNKSILSNLSVVIPVFNEQGNVETLAEEIKHTLNNKYHFEIVFIDDASTDNTLSILKKIQSQFPALKIVHHKTNAGQSAAIVTGVKAAKYDWIVTLDGDRQNNPADIPKLIETALNQPLINDKFLCTGYRATRHDNFIRKTSSLIANKVRSFFLKDHCSDSACGIKLFSKQLFLTLPHFKNCHRFLPALFKRAGATIINTPVTHRERASGKSKYGINNRLWVGIVDLFGVAWLMRRPIDVEKEDDSSL